MSATLTSGAGLTETVPALDFVTVIHGAVTPERFTHDELVWGFFQLIHFKEQRRPGSAASFLEQDVGMSPDAARSLVTYAQHSHAQNRDLAEVQLGKVCDDFTRQRLGSVADRLAAEDLISSRFQQGRIAGLAQMLDAKTRGRLDDWIAASFTPSYSLVKIDYERMLRHPGAAEALAERLRELCSGGDPDDTDIVSR